MRRALWAFLICYGSLTVTAADRKAATDLVQAQGIVAYDIDEAQDGRVRVRLVRRGREATPPLEVLILRTGRNPIDTDVTFQPEAGELVRIDWTLSAAKITMRQGNESVAVFWDDAERSWKRDGSEALYQRLAKTVEMIGTVIVDFTERGVLGQDSRGGAGLRGPDDSAAPGPADESSGELGSNLTQDTGTGGDGMTPPPTCSGKEVRGSSVGNTASYACRGASADAKALCANCKCSTCCFFWDCDVSCAFGDHIICVAGRSGKACAEPVFGCGFST